MMVGLAILGGITWFLFWIWPEPNQEWICYLEDGGFIYTESEPDGDWVEATDGVLYPRDRIEECTES